MTSEDATPAAPEAPATIEGRIERWRERLLELSKRNPLINMRLGDRGAIELVRPMSNDIWTSLFAGARLSFPRKRALLGLERGSNSSDDDEPDDSGANEALPPLDAGYADTSSDRGAPARARRRAGDEADPRELDLDACVQSPLFRPGHLLTTQTDKLAGRRLTRLNLNARTSLTETGVNILFMTFGALRWYESPESDAPLLAPLLLVPVRLLRENIDSPWMIVYEDEDVAINFTIGHKLATDFGFEWPNLPEEFDPSAASYAEYFDRVRASVRSAHRWVVEERVGLGVFSFQKIAMWRDLGEHKAAIASHDMCCAIAGEPLAMGADGRIGIIDIREADQKIKPRDLHHIRDCDSTQLEAILAAKAGMSFVLDGPPGTGKSQTITNIISEFIASGKTVLFVSEKAAALEVVKRRLDETGLGDFCLECHSHKANKKVVLDELNRSLNIEPVRYRDQREDLDRLFETRAQLTAYVRTLHKARSALDLTPYQVHGRLAEIPTRGVTRCSIPSVLEVDRPGLRRMQETIAALKPHQHVLDVQERHPWRGTLVSVVSLTEEDDVRHRLTATATALEELRSVVGALAELGFGPADPILKDLEVTVASARDAAAAPDVPLSWFSSNTTEVCRSVIKLDVASRTASELRRALPGYRPDVQQAWGEKPPGAMRALGGPWLPRFKRLPSPTVRGEIVRCDTTLSSLGVLAAELVTLRNTIATLGDALRQTTAGASLQAADQLVAIGELVGGLDDIQFAWVDHGVRGQLRAVVDKCVPVSQKLERCRETLEGVGCVKGFDDPGGEVARDAEKYASFWRRLTPGWWRLRGRARALYGPGVVRGTSALLSDLHELRTFHECRRSIARETETLVRQLPPALSTTDAWVRFGSTLEKLDQLRASSSDGDALVAALGQPAGVNRQIVRRLVETLRAQLASTRHAAEGVAQSWTIELVGTTKLPLELAPADDLLLSVEEARGAISASRALLVDWSDLLLDACDVPFEQLQRDAQLLDQLVAAHARVTKTFKFLQGQVAEVADPSKHDWSAVARAAHWTLERLEKHAGTVPSPVVRVVSDPNTRRSLRGALGAFDRTVPGVTAGYHHVRDVFPEDADVSTGITLRAASLTALGKWLVERAGDVRLLREWTEFRRAIGALERLGLGEMGSEICARQLTLDDAGNAFLKRFYRAWLDAIYAQDPVLRDFRFAEHEKVIDQFRELDRAAISGNAKRIREKLLTSPDRPTVSHLAPRTSELGTLLREANKKRRHMPLRQLFKEIPALLTKLKPCLMMSPLAVSTFFDLASVRFDLVIFDEASQVRPQDAIGAVYRGKQLVVAGDQRQLPPTSFFEAAARDDGASDEDEDDIGDFESILDVGVTTGMPRKSLKWHYRSRRESLIAFSNHHIYDGELVTFPSARDTPGSSAVTLVHVPDGRWVRSGKSARNPVEARRVAEIVFEHFRTRPKQSIGVVAFSQTQQLAILAEIERLRRARPELEEFFDEERHDPFFVKNLENVQGDERNVIVISVGYGYDSAGKFSMNFGPINKQGGERRLNVLVTRATDGITLVSSVRAHDLDLGRGKSRGVELLKYYLDYAERGVETLGVEAKEHSEADFDSPFEAEVWRALRDLGHDVRRQIGCSGYRVDLAIVHPQRAGEFVLGVECDGATYHSSLTARDRDRLRQEVLEDLGWRIVRVWSTDWVLSPQRQLDRVVGAYEQALRGGPSETASGRVPRVAPDDDEPVPVMSSGRAQTAPGVAYESIEGVPRAAIAEAVLAALRNYGATPMDELVRVVAQSLGFQRAGRKIRQAVERSVATLVATRKVVHGDDGRLTMSAASR